MAWTSGFFNSLNGDRVYNANQMSEIFDGLITNGVYESIDNKLAVQPNNGMTIQINTGRGWFGGRWVNNDSEYLHTLEESDVLLNRYCAVCVRVNLDESSRTAEPYFKYSEFASNPVKPTMERTETIKEYCLAYIYIRANTTSIKAQDIEDTRGNTNLCGWVTGLIKQVDTDTLWTQWQSQWEDFMSDNASENENWQAEQREAFLNWYNSLEDYLTADAETKLTNDVLQLQADVGELQSDVEELQTKGGHTKYTATFDGLGWISHDDGLYTQTVTVEGIKATDYIIVIPTEEYKTTYVTMGCEAIEQSDNAITFSCPNPDDINMVVDVIVIGV